MLPLAFAHRGLDQLRRLRDAIWMGRNSCWPSPLRYAVRVVEIVGAACMPFLILLVLLDWAQPTWFALSSPLATITSIVAVPVGVLFAVLGLWFYSSLLLALLVAVVRFWLFAIHLASAVLLWLASFPAALGRDPERLARLREDAAEILRHAHAAFFADSHASEQSADEIAEHAIELDLREADALYDRFATWAPLVTTGLRCGLVLLRRSWKTSTAKVES